MGKGIGSGGNQRGGGKGGGGRGSGGKRSGNPNFPSTIGNKLGGSRGNNPPKK